MNINDKEMWVFLSHSNEDYDKVRLVRNILEEQHMRPIMFFLKCLNDDDEEEIFSLIKREIDSRTRFILCDSPNARKSTWVQREVNYMKQKERRIQTIDLTKSEEEISRELISYKEKQRIFISYSRNDFVYAKALVDRLRKYDLFVFFDADSMTSGTEIENCIFNAIQDTKTSGGFFICLLSSRYLNGSWGKEEFKMARHYDCKILGIETEPTIKEDPFLKFLKHFTNEFKIIQFDKQECQINEAVEYVLNEMYDVNSVLAFADDFHKGNGRKKDLKEAEFCFNIYREQAERSQNPYAILSLAKCYSQGRGTVIDLVKSFDYYEAFIINVKQLIEADKIKQYKNEMQDIYNRMSNIEKERVDKHFFEQT